MENQRFVPTEENSFFGAYLYDQIIPADHFLRKLRELIDWDHFTQRLIRLYKGEGVVGRPPFDPALLLKIEVLAYLYNLSERQVEVYVNENLPAKFFLGLAIDQKAPDHSTLTVFRQRLIAREQLKIFEELLEMIVQQALEKGVQFGAIQIIDSVHSVANVNTAKDKNRRGKGKGPHDPDARWGAKHKRKFKDEQGRDIDQVEYFYGYKAHVSLNAEAGLITGLQTTSGEAADGKQFCPLVNHDLAQQLPVKIYAADKAYDDGDNHLHLELSGRYSAIHLKKTRTQKKDSNKQVWLELAATPQYQAGRKERYKIERKFGEAKQGHGLGRCRYLGRLGFGIQAFLTGIALNLKRMVKVLSGIGFKTANVVLI